MKKKIFNGYKARWLCLLCILIFSISSRCYSSEQNEIKHEKTFYAISSLYFHLKEITSELSPKGNNNTILFEDSDIAFLWELAASDSVFFHRVDKAQRFYYEAINKKNHEKQASLYLKTAKLLGAIWEELDSYLLKEISSLVVPTVRSTFLPFHELTYSNFDGNPYLTNNMRKRIKPYLMPVNFIEKGLLDAMFTKSRVIETETSFLAAGFEILFRQPYSFVRVARHPAFPGYIFKVYLDSELRKKGNKAGWDWLTCRCEGAENVRNLIKQKNLIYFSVPDKWIYPLPVHPSPKDELKKSRQPIILVVTDMELVEHEESIDAWKNKITRAHLKELYCILSHGFASSHLIWNIPYSKSGKFACIDTENPKKQPEYKEVKNYLSEEMCLYWDELVKKGGSTVY